MSNFIFLDSYKVSNVQQTNSLKHIFYTVDFNTIKIAEEKLGFQIPKELKQFYLEIGYGFFWQNDKRSFDRLLSPLQLAQINLREDFYEFDPDLEIYDEEDRLIFFEANEGLYLTILKNEVNDKNAIYFFDEKVANSLEEFLIELDKNPNFIDDIASKLE